MDDKQIHDTPSDVEAEAGVVMMNGPDGVAVSLTPEAAIETGSRLIDAGAEAHGKDLLQRKEGEMPPRHSAP